MSLRTLLVSVVVADIILTLSCIGIALSGLSTVTEVSAVGQDESLVPRWVDRLAFVLFVVAVIVGWIGILRFWGPGRYCYICAWALSLFNIATTVSRVEAGWSFALQTLAAICGGFLLSLIFCSELRRVYVPDAA